MKYLATILLLTLAFVSKSQTFINRAGAANTVIDQRLGAAQNFYLPRLMDTTLSGGKDTIGNLIYDRLRAKIAIRDTVLAGGHKFTFLFKTDDTSTTLATKYDLTQLANGPTVYTGDGALTGDRHISGGVNGFAFRIDSTSSISLFSGLEYPSSGIGAFIQMSDSVINMGGSSTTDFTSFTFSPTRIKFTAADGAGTSGDVWTNVGSGYGHWAAASGGGATLNNIGTGFAWAATPGGNIKRVANSNTILWDSTSTVNSLTAKADTSVLATQYDLTQVVPSLTETQIAFGGPGNTTTSSPFLNYISATHYLTADTVRNRKNIVDTTLYMPFTLVPSGLRYAAIGDSYTVGTDATVIPDSAYTGRFSEYYSLPLDNYAITGVGAVTSTYQHFVNINYPNPSLTGAMFGLNNLRYGGADRRTINKVLNGYKNIFCNQFSKTFYPASNNTVITRHGSWTTGWASFTGGGKGGVQGAFTNTINDSIKYNFTDSTVWFSIITGDGSGSIYTSPTIEVYIDGVLQETINLNEQTDGQVDGSFDGRLIPCTRYYTGLSYASHTLRIVNKSSLFLLMDGFGNLIDKSIANTYVMWHVPRLNPTGYAVSPANSSDAITDTMNVKIDSLYATLPSWYPVYVARSNDYFDRHAGMSADSIHPNNLGHHQLFDAAVAALGSSSLLIETGSVFRANDNLYLKKQFELAKIVTGDAVFNQGQTIFNDTMRIGALNDKPVAIISNGQTAVTFRQNQGVYSNVMDAYGPVRVFGPLFAETGGIELKAGWSFALGVSNMIGSWSQGGSGWGMNSGYTAVANNRNWAILGVQNGLYFRLSDDANTGATATNWLVAKRNALHVDSIQFPMGKIYFGEMTEGSATDSSLDWDRSTQQIIKVPKSSKVTTLTSSAGTLLLGNTEAYVFNGTTTTWTLPAVSGNTGVKYYIKNRGSGNITLNSNAGGNDIYDSGATNSITISAGSAITLINDGTYWNVLP